MFSENVWSPTEIAQLRRLHGLGCSASEISEAVGRSRNACVSKTRRLGLRGHDRSEQCRKGYYRCRFLQPVAQNVVGA